VGLARRRPARAVLLFRERAAVVPAVVARRLGVGRIVRGLPIRVDLKSARVSIAPITHIVGQERLDVTVDVVVFAKVVDVVEAQAAKVEAVAGVLAHDERTLELVPVGLVDAALVVGRGADVMSGDPVTEGGVVGCGVRKREQGDEREGEQRGEAHGGCLGCSGRSEEAEWV